MIFRGNVVAYIRGPSPFAGLVSSKTSGSGVLFLLGWRNYDRLCSGVSVDTITTHGGKKNAINR